MAPALLIVGLHPRVSFRFCGRVSRDRRNLEAGAEIAHLDAKLVGAHLYLQPDLIVGVARPVEHRVGHQLRNQQPSVLQSFGVKGLL